jgi:ubiquinone/menaquinone biosynthesis C-methylase UbiE
MQEQGGVTLDEEQGAGRHHHRSGHNPWDDYERLRHLAHPDRERWMPRAPVLALMQLAEGMHVADVGAGSGYLVGELATAVGRAGKVYAIDPAPAARRHLQERFGEAAPQVVVVEGTGERVPLPDNILDRMVWHCVYHELQDPIAGLQEARRLLKPGGRLVIVDWDPAFADMGPPVSERVPRPQAEESALGAGFEVEAAATGSPATWGLVAFRP